MTDVTVTAQTLDQLASSLGQTRIALNFTWTLLCGFLVMFMQAGFALVETGFCRAKNASHTFFMNFAVYFLGLTGYWIAGFALQEGNAAGLASLGGVAPLHGSFTLTLFGKPFSLFGTSGFYLNHGVYDTGVYTLFLFKVVFMDTAATIPTGAMAERWKTSNFIFYCFFMSMLVYPVYAHWVWGHGWLSQLGTHFGLGHGHVDFAGALVVHLLGGVAALAGARAIGPRLGKFDRNGNSVPIPGHHIPMIILGSFVLALGWFGFNAGSTLDGHDQHIGVVAVNTMLASAGGGLAAMVYLYLKIGIFDPAMSANGFLAGMVAITAPCAFVPATSAFFIGSVAGILVCLSVNFVENALKVDDPVGAISVHGTCGAWGVLAAGLFADGSYGEGWNGVAGGVRGLFYGDAGQFGAQVVGILANLAWTYGAFWAFFKVTDLVWGIRVAKEKELAGLDLGECGTLAYPEFPLKKL